MSSGVKRKSPLCSHETCPYHGKSFSNKCLAHASGSDILIVLKNSPNSLRHQWLKTGWKLLSFLVKKRHFTSADVLHSLIQEVSLNSSKNTINEKESYTIDSFMHSLLVQWKTISEFAEIEANIYHSCANFEFNRASELNNVLIKLHEMEKNRLLEETKQYDDNNSQNTDGVTLNDGGDHHVDVITSENTNSFIFEMIKVFKNILNENLNETIFSPDTMILKWNDIMFSKRRQNHRRSEDNDEIPLFTNSQNSSANTSREKSSPESKSNDSNSRSRDRNTNSNRGRSQSFNKHQFRGSSPQPTSSTNQHQKKDEEEDEKRRHTHDSILSYSANHQDHNKSFHDRPPPLLYKSAHHGHHESKSAPSRIFRGINDETDVSPDISNQSTSKVRKVESEPSLMTSTSSRRPSNNSRLHKINDKKNGGKMVTNHSGGGGGGGSLVNGSPQLRPIAKRVPSSASTTPLRRSPATISNPRPSSTTRLTSQNHKTRRDSRNLSTNRETGRKTNHNGSNGRRMMSQSVDSVLSSSSKKKNMNSNRYQRISSSSSSNLKSSNSNSTLTTSTSLNSKDQSSNTLHHHKQTASRTPPEDSFSILCEDHLKIFSLELEKDKDQYDYNDDENNLLHVLPYRGQEEFQNRRRKNKNPENNKQKDKEGENQGVEYDENTSFLMNDSLKGVHEEKEEQGKEQEEDKSSTYIEVPRLFSERKHNRNHRQSMSTSEFRSSVDDVIGPQPISDVSILEIELQHHEKNKNNQDYE